MFTKHIILYIAYNGGVSHYVLIAFQKYHALRKRLIENQEMFEVEALS